ncbi:MAG: 3-deoxy-D-manno-octulosonic acid transferase [Desulfobulbaceae bacterium]|nr:3-deoxy-D-manno-octulosonic acid transferase [Desulfobulbaceae bacterium]
MLAVYNLIQLLGLVFLWPLLLLLVVCRAKYRLRIPARLGLGLSELAGKIPAGRPRIWIHALSVGEVSSAVTLVQAIRVQFPDAVLLFSAATSSGEKFARSSKGLPVDLFIPFPLDVYPVVRRFVKALRPDLFLLVETDFWPNFLHEIAAENIAALLVNGRISRKSYRKYSFFQAFFLPMFRSFSFLAMQRQEDMEKMVSLGVAADKVKNLGNLKYDAMLPKMGAGHLSRKDLGIAAARPLLIAGSTHDGEEEILCRVYQELAGRRPDLFFIIAPRNIERAAAVVKLARNKGLAVATRRTGSKPDDQLMVLDTMGELAGLYRLADVAFIGGSLVPQGGHNPLEPAVAGIPVLFGRHMEDFADVVEDMLAAGCASQVNGEDELLQGIAVYLQDAGKRKEKGEAARRFVEARQGVNMRHMNLIRQVLS